MKKYFSLILLGAIAVACTKDDPASIDAPETAAITTSTSVIYEAVDPTTEEPAEAYDNSSRGMYHGIIVTQDVSVHGKIWINIANDGDFNATVVTNEGEKMAFFGVPSTDEKMISFEGDNGSFTYDLSDFNAPKATNVTVNGISGYVQTVKDRSNQRATATLGTYVDLNDETFTGTWDLLTDGSTTGTAFGLPALTQVCFMSPFGVMYTDDAFEPFSYPCWDIDGDMDGDIDDITAPVYLNQSGTPDGINEFWAQDQSVDVNGITLSYWLGQSSFLSQGADDGGTDDRANSAWLNNNLDVIFGDPRVDGCFIFTGFKGIWVWNGRLGSVSFDDEFDGMPPTRANDSSIDYDGLSEAMSSLSPQKAELPVQ